MKELVDYLTYKVAKNDVAANDTNVIKVISSLRYSQVGEFKLKEGIEGVDTLIKETFGL